MVRRMATLHAASPEGFAARAIAFAGGTCGSRRRERAVPWHSEGEREAYENMSERVRSTLRLHARLSVHTANSFGNLQHVLRTRWYDLGIAGHIPAPAWDPPATPGRRNVPFETVHRNATDTALLRATIAPVKIYRAYVTFRPRN